MWMRATLRCQQRPSNGSPPAGTLKAWLGGEAGGSFNGGPVGAPVRAATEGNLPRVMPQGTLVEVLSNEVRRQGN